MTMIEAVAGAAARGAEPVRACARPGGEARPGRRADRPGTAATAAIQYGRVRRRRFRARRRGADPLVPQRRRRRRGWHAGRDRDDPGECRGRRHPPRHLPRFSRPIYQRPGQRRVRVGFDVQSVQRDGQAEHYTTERIRGGVRVKIGDADSYVDRGQHTYVLRYTTTRQLGFFAGYDELYWNVTGNFWRFPIDSAEVHIRLPQAVPFGPERAFYTGSQGSTAHDAEVISERPGEIVIRTTARLGARRGLHRRGALAEGRGRGAGAALAGAALVPGLCAAGRRDLGAARPGLLLLLRLEEGRPRPGPGNRGAALHAAGGPLRGRDPLYPPHGLRQSLLRRRDRGQRRASQAAHGGGREGPVPTGEDARSSRPRSRTTCPSRSGAC